MKPKYNFEDLYKQYYKYVAVVCSSIIGSQDADDMAQNTFLKVFEYLSKFRNECHIRTWIHHIAVNECAMFVRAAHRLKARTEEKTKSFEEIFAIDKHGDIQNIGTKLNCIKPVPVPEKLTFIKAVENLAPKYRLYTILHCIEGYEYEEIAQVTGKNIGTAKGAVSRARNILQRKMK